ncbi:raffinose/stachyose/melibiose transport system substrate-binding protein [Thermomonospora echinospora]|uniref:Raffinose/stachyose/melibiose transport system substrate-binding protein n=1 Tax=Thermomonospora echinospora TaxID=1992 RepID=A0A1H6DJK0_9ACTN|nr:extracellular solute-binding protein [Thermomonospora echinospora]SEG85577.1 raffinose/stachyose/melibiose transport system substrate-binding protein [Thermomonospora echinospora]
MRRTHRLTAVMVAGVTLAAGACSSGTNASGGSDTLRITAVATDRAGTEAVLKAFQAKNPGVKLTTSYSDTDQYQGTLRTQLSSGTAPDVFFAWPGNGNPAAIEVLAPTGYLADLSGRSWTARIPAGIKPVTQVAGKTYIVPMTFVGIGGLYNQQAMNEIGAKPPTTWSQLLAFCDTAKAKGKVAFALGNQTDWVTQLVNYALVPTTVYASDQSFDQRMKAGAATFAGSGWKTALTKYLEMNERGCFSKDPLGTSFETSVAQLAKGDAVAAIQVTSTLNQVKSQAPQGTGFGLFPVPATDDSDETRMPGAAGGAFALNAKAKNPELASKFIDFLATPEAMNAYAGATGNLPSIPNDQFKHDPALQPLVDFQKAGKTVHFMDQLWPNPKVQQTHFTGVQNLFAGKADPDTVLRQMDEAYQGE